MSKIPPRTELVPIARGDLPAIPVLPSVTVHDLYQALLADSLCENTRLSRQWDCVNFARWLGAASPSAGCAAFVSGGRGRANAIGMAYRAHELGRGMAPSSVNRGLSFLRKLVVLARRLDLIEYTVDIPNIPDHHTSDRRGPSLPDWRSLWAAAVAAGAGQWARRDRAILLLLRDSALRKAEVVGLDYPGDLDPARPAVRIVGKGRSGRKQWVSVNAATSAALSEWVEARGECPGPLFLACVAGGPSTGGRRLAVPARRIDSRTINRVLIRLAKAAGLTTGVRPHGLRHSGITRALDLTHGDIRKVAHYARHANPKTTMLYDDARKDFAGEIAGLLGDDDE